jgi:hypothetical protein
MGKHIITIAMLLSLVVPATTSAQVVQNTATLPVVNRCITLTNTNLRYGVRDTSANKDVAALQSFLSAQGYLKSAPTGFFGALTLAAVKKYQVAYFIQTTGFVGPITRASIKVQSCKGVVVIPGCGMGALYNAITGARCSTGLVYPTSANAVGSIGFSGGVGTPGTPPTGAAKKIAILSPLTGDKFNVGAVVPIYYGLVSITGPQVVTVSLLKQAGSSDTLVNTKTFNQDIKNGINRIDFTPASGSSYTADQLTGTFKIKLEVGNNGTISDSTGYFTIGTLRLGDINGDGQISISDYIDLASMYGERAGEPGFKAAADLNSDGIIDAVDFKKFNTLMQLGNYGVTIRSGDIDGDNQVSINDFINMAGMIGKKTGDSGFDPKADLDYSGVIDATDFKIMDILFRAANE